MKLFLAKLRESISSVLPISVIVLLLSVTLAPINAGIFTLFFFGILLLVVGIGLFTLGSDMAMTPLGQGVGAFMNRFKWWVIPGLIALVLGFLITISEPDLRVLARQVPGIPDQTLIFCVALGVGAFLVLAMIRSRFQIPLYKLLLFFYAAVLILAFLAPKDFVATAFDSGGVTTGPMTVPFIMALGSGLSSTARHDKHGDSGFGMVALSSIGPILSVLILSITYHPEASTSPYELFEVTTTRQAVVILVSRLPVYLGEVAMAILPLLGVFGVFQLASHRFHRHQIGRILIGMLYTYIGLVLFLTGANVGFMPVGRLMGASLAGGEIPTLLIPAGALMGYFIVAAEPAVHVLKKQVEEVSNGAISQHTIRLSLSIGVAVSVGLAMLRVLTGLPILPFLVGGYLISLAISFFVPPLYTAVAFDAGGVASGPMATTFLIPFAVGACEVLGGNLLTDAFGIVAFVALTPLITIQLIGLWSALKTARRKKTINNQLSLVEDEIIYYD